MTTRRFTITIAALLVTTGFLAGCVDSGCEFNQGTMSGGSGQEGACNETDSFAYGTQASVMSDTKTWTWENTQGSAEATWGFQGTGDVTLTIQDADGTTVLQRSIGGMGQGASSATTDSGTPGAWTIQLRFSNFQGQMGVGVQAG